MGEAVALDPIMASQIRGYQIYRIPQIDPVSTVTRQIVKRRAAETAVWSNRKESHVVIGMHAHTVPLFDTASLETCDKLTDDFIGLRG
jgi:hypothetical protein